MYHQEAWKEIGIIRFVNRELLLHQHQSQSGSQCSEREVTKFREIPTRSV